MYILEMPPLVWWVVPDIFGHILKSMEPIDFKFFLRVGGLRMRQCDLRTVAHATMQFAHRARAKKGIFYPNLPLYEFQQSIDNSFPVYFNGEKLLLCLIPQLFVTVQMFVR